MEKLIEMKEFNDRIAELWKNRPVITSNDDGKRDREKDCLERSPLQYPDLRANIDILFVGMNPSYIIETNSKIKDKFSSVPEDYKWEKFSEKQNKLIECEKEARKLYEAYFKKINNFGKFTEETDPKCFQLSKDLSIEIIDLIYLRETSQRVVKKIIKNGDKLNDFGNSQVQLSLELIKKLNPKVLIVVNAEASKIIKEKLNVKSNDFNSEYGTYEIKINEDKIPVFFSGMLSGQHAIDNESYNRLRWQVLRYFKGCTKE